MSLFADDMLQRASLVAQTNSCNDRDPGPIPGLERSRGEGNVSPLQNSCLENPMAEEPGGVTKSQTRLSTCIVYGVSVHLAPLRTSKA